MNNEKGLAIEKLDKAPETLSSKVRQLEERWSFLERVVGEIEATMLVNFGEQGRTIPNLIKETDTPLQMVINTIQHYQDNLNKKDKK